MKKGYLKPELRILEFENDDIVTLSTPDAEPDPFDFQGGKML